ncbi:Subtilase family protein [Gemmobacter aquatilis]|uniref:Subtilase family protein n=1 Tax=Gemmobacter aquatilis TaxID=933059 RepID=A0A1H8KMB6_9RHOB|nr:S8 family serine peptidase [Gemmobacter aquatilis]SEN94015.1 Subtilase family protein [Gemmobacter aquatilis]
MNRPALTRLTILLLITAMAGATPWAGGPDPSMGAAWADDDDDDGGRDDDDRGNGDRPTARAQGRGGPAPLRQRRVAPRVIAPAPVPPPPTFAPEIVTLGLTAGDAAVLLGEGFALIETRALPGFGRDLHRFAPPPGVTLTTARDRVRALPSGGTADFNHYYRSGQDILPAAAPSPAPADCRHGNCQSHALVGWPDAAARAARCAVPPVIGVIDTGVNQTHDLLTGARIDVQGLAAEGGDPSAKVHGTAVLSVLAGRPGSRVEGLLPEARYVVVDVFTRAGRDERADVVALLRGLDLMDSHGVRVVNLSLAGPANTALETMVRRLIEDRSMVLVAAVGNGGAQQPVAYPAAYAGVIGVTALDSRGRVYRAAQRGAEVDLAAPGVGLLLATSIRGARAQTGTSFATPFVTAAAALVLAQAPALGSEEVAARLAGTARDSGDTGRDDVFGHGLLQAGALCPALPAAERPAAPAILPPGE